MTHTCTYCNVEKDVDLFVKSINNSRGYLNICKKCRNESQKHNRAASNNIYTKKYEKTKKGFAVRLYRNMKSRVFGVQKKCPHLYVGKEILPKEDFYNWILNNEKFHALFSRYKASNYDIRLAPSVDRIDSSIGYTLNNIQILTNSENCAKTSRRKVTNIS